MKASYNLPKCIVFDLDKTVMFARPTLLSSNDSERLQRLLGSVYAKDEYDYCLVLMKDKLDKILKIAIENNIPIIFMTQGVYHANILPAILNAGKKNDQDEYNLKCEPYHFTLKANEYTQQKKIRSGDYYRYIIRMKGVKENKKTTIFYFNRFDVGMDLHLEYEQNKRYFESMQCVLESLKNQTPNFKGTNINLSWTQYNKTYGEVRKPVSVLVTLLAIASTCPEYKERLNITSREFNLKDIILLDDSHYHIEVAEKLGITGIQADVLIKREYFYALNNAITYDHYDKLIFLLEKALGYKNEESCKLGQNYCVLFPEKPITINEEKQIAKTVITDNTQIKNDNIVGNDTITSSWELV